MSITALIVPSVRANKFAQIGPFIDSAHPLVKNGDMDKTPEALFRDVFVKGLVEVLNAQPGCSGIIVPSVRDILSDHAVFPQCELDVSQPVDPVRLYNESSH